MSIFVVISVCVIFCCSIYSSGNDIPEREKSEKLTNSEEIKVRLSGSVSYEERLSEDESSFLTSKD